MARRLGSVRVVFLYFLKRSGRVERVRGVWHLQQLVTAKLLATSRLSMCGVSLNSEVPN